MYHSPMYKPKLCIICGTSYSPNSSRQKVCKICLPKYRHDFKYKWRQDHLEQDNATRKKWYWNNLEKVREIKCRWNWGKGVEYRKKYYANKKEEVKKHLEQYKEKTTSRIKANRIIKENGIERICSECGSIKKVQIHHKDFNPFNNSISNLDLVCLKHHILIHRQKRLQLDQNQLDSSIVQ